MKVPSASFDGMDGIKWKDKKHNNSFLFAPNFCGASLSTLPILKSLFTRELENSKSMA
jgi:hypothetical protein